MRFYEAIVKARREIKKDIQFARRYLNNIIDDEYELNRPMEDMKFSHNMCDKVCNYCKHGRICGVDKPLCTLNKNKECVKTINTDKCKFEEAK